MFRAVLTASCLCLALASLPASGTAQEEAGPGAPCTKVYHADLAAIRGIADKRIDDAVEAARDGDKALPGKWVFPPARRVPKSLREAHNLAARMVRSRVRDPWFHGDNATWLTRKLRNDVERYLKQPMREGLCAPPDPMLGFLEEKLAQLGPRRGQVARARQEALSAARKTAMVALAGLSEASTGAINANAALHPASDEADAYTLVTKFRMRMDIAAPEDKPVDALAALVALHKAFSAHPAMRKGADVRKSLLPALQALERAAYLARLDAVYAEYHDAFSDTLAAIRIAYRAHCTCR